LCSKLYLDASKLDKVTHVRFMNMYNT
ncbi:hypothetical protein PCK2_001048, partial [Pneumocystis canis]